MGAHDVVGGRRDQQPERGQHADPERNHDPPGPKLRREVAGMQGHDAPEGDAGRLFDTVFEAYVEAHEVRTFFDENNPATLREIAERVAEAVERGLWQPRSNSAHVVLADLAGG